MSWKREIQLIDLDKTQRLEATCQKCGHSRYPNIHELATKQGLAYEYLDEVERNLICVNRGCDGRIRLALTHQGDTEGFVAGLA